MLGIPGERTKAAFGGVQVAGRPGQGAVVEIGQATAEPGRHDHAAAGPRAGRLDDRGHPRRQHVERACPQGRVALPDHDQEGRLGQVGAAVGTRVERRGRQDLDRRALLIPPLAAASAAVRPASRPTAARPGRNREQAGKELSPDPVMIVVPNRCS